MLSGVPDSALIPKAPECSLAKGPGGLFIWRLLAVQERLFAWLGGLRASDICGGLLAKLSEHGMANGQRMKLEALRVRLLHPFQSSQLSLPLTLPAAVR